MNLEPVTKFRFLCHRSLSCFNECCRNLTLALTPYDVLRLRRKLGMGSSSFLERYTNWHVGHETGLPVVVLKTKNGCCPFVRDYGCSVYSDRPSACRLYPLARLKVGSGEYYYLLREDFCLGHNEAREWSVEEWVADQGADVYNTMNDLFAELIAVARAKRFGADVAEKIYMACFDLDRFRMATRLKCDDVELMKKGIRWSISLLERL